MTWMDGHLIKTETFTGLSSDTIRAIALRAWIIASIEIGREGGYAIIRMARSGELTRYKVDPEMVIMQKR
jgi:hypothetical protein